MKTYYITFGSGHIAGFGLHYHMTITAPSELLARKVAGDVWGGKWSSIYPEEKGLEYSRIYSTRSIGHIDVQDEYSYQTRRALSPDKMKLRTSMKTLIEGPFDASAMQELIVMVREYLS